MRDFKNDVCNAYAYIEYNKSFEVYRQHKDNQDLTSMQKIRNWNELVKTYKILSLHMTDEAIVQAQEALNAIHSPY